MLKGWIYIVPKPWRLYFWNRFKFPQCYYKKRKDIGLKVNSPYWHNHPKCISKFLFQASFQSRMAVLNLVQIQLGNDLICIVWSQNLKWLYKCCHFFGLEVSTKSKILPCLWVGSSMSCWRFLAKGTLQRVVGKDVGAEWLCT